MMKEHRLWKCPSPPISPAHCFCRGISQQSKKWKEARFFRRDIFGASACAQREKSQTMVAFQVGRIIIGDGTTRRCDNELPRFISVFFG